MAKQGLRLKIRRRFKMQKRSNTTTISGPVLSLKKPKLFNALQMQI
jgi:hypothetical protein